MKRILLLIFIFSCINFTFASPAENNFSIKDGKLVWQKVFDTELTKNELFRYFAYNGAFEVIKEEDSTLLLQHKKAVLNFKPYKGAVIMAMHSPATAQAVIQYKDGKYRVTVTDVIYHSDLSVSLRGVSTNSNTQYSLDEIAYNFKKQEYRSSFKSRGYAEMMNNIFIDLFTIGELSHSDDNW